MREMVDKMALDREGSETKSYLIGLERGRIWASDYADYFEMKEWSELKIAEFEDLVLPADEDLHFRIMGEETPLEWKPYLKGWLDGVKEISNTY